MQVTFLSERLPDFSQAACNCGARPGKPLKIKHFIIYSNKYMAEKRKAPI